MSFLSETPDLIQGASRLFMGHQERREFMEEQKEISKEEESLEEEIDRIKPIETPLNRWPSLIVRGVKEKALFSPKHKIEATASNLSYWTMIILTLIILVGMGVPEFFGLKTPILAQDFIQKTLPGITTLMGIIFGFYFAKERLGQP